MKWVGQHIWDFTSRFRSKVYFEGVADAGSDTDAFLVKKADGELAMRTGNQVLSDLGITAGEIVDWTTDQGGTNIHTENIHDLHGAGVNGLQYNILTDNGSGSIVSNSSFKYQSDQLIMVSTASRRPRIALSNSHDDGEGAEIEFTKAPIIGSPGMLDEIGTIKYTGLDSNDDGQTYAEIKVQQGHYTHGSESGIMKIEVATQGTLRNVLSATGQHNVSEVDITLGYGANSNVHLNGNLILNPGNITIGGHSFGDIDIGSEFVDTDDHIMSSGAIKEKIESYGYVTSNDDVSVANLKTRLGSGFGSNAVSIGDSDDTVTIPGNLTVSGTTTTINTANLNVEDKNITLNYHATNDTSAAANGAGITIQDGISANNDVSLLWDKASGIWNTDFGFAAKIFMSHRTEIMMNTNGSGSGESLTLQSTSQGGNKTISFPNATGTLALTSNIPTTKGFLNFYFYGATLSTLNNFYSNRWHGDWGVSNLINSGITDYNDTSQAHWRIIRNARIVPYDCTVTKFMANVEHSGTAETVEVSLWRGYVNDSTAQSSGVATTIDHLCTLTFTGDDVGTSSKTQSQNTTSFNATSLDQGDYVFVLLRRTTGTDGSQYHVHSTILFDY